MSIDIFHSLVHSLRIHTKDGEDASTTAARVMAIHSELMIKARQCGLLTAMVATE